MKKQCNYDRTSTSYFLNLQLDLIKNTFDGNKRLTFSENRLLAKYTLLFGKLEVLEEESKICIDEKARIYDFGNFFKIHSDFLIDHIVATELFAKFSSQSSKEEQKANIKNIKTHFENLKARSSKIDLNKKYTQQMTEETARYLLSIVFDDEYVNTFIKENDYIFEPLEREALGTISTVHQRKN